MINETEIRLPARLKPGDRIGIVAPAGPFDRKTLARGVHVLEQQGFDVVVPDGVFEANGYLAGSDDHRARLVNQLFSDNAIDAIICARGGYGSLRILPLLDYDAIARNPKVFIGFSDITALLTVFFDRCGLVTFHGPVLTSLADAHELTVRSLIHALTSGDNVQIKVPNGTTIKPGTASGILCGGNLATICHLFGTPFAPGFAGKIVFLEDRAEAPYKIDRMLMQIKLADGFDGIAGIVLGSFEQCGPPEEILSIVKAVLGECQVPILAGLDAGHGPLNFTLPMGIEATLDADRHMLSYHRVATI